jgi:hypothetical protein
MAINIEEVPMKMLIIIFLAMPMIALAQDNAQINKGMPGTNPVTNPNITPGNRTPDQDRLINPEGAQDAIKDNRSSRTEVEKKAKSNSDRSKGYGEPSTDSDKGGY